jgi:hypothetical protein
MIVYLSDGLRVVRHRMPEPASQRKWEPLLQGWLTEGWLWFCWCDEWGGEAPGAWCSVGCDLSRYRTPDGLDYTPPAEALLPFTDDQTPPAVEWGHPDDIAPRPMAGVHLLRARIAAAVENLERRRQAADTIPVAAAYHKARLVVEALLEEEGT